MGRIDRVSGATVELTRPAPHVDRVIPTTSEERHVAEVDEHARRSARVAQLLTDDESSLRVSGLTDATERGECPVLHEVAIDEPALIANEIGVFGSEPGPPQRV